MSPEPRVWRLSDQVTVNPYPSRHPKREPGALRYVVVTRDYKPGEPNPNKPYRNPKRPARRVRRYGWRGFRKEALLANSEADPRALEADRAERRQAWRGVWK